VILISRGCCDAPFMNGSLHCSSSNYNNSSSDLSFHIVQHASTSIHHEHRTDTCMFQLCIILQLHELKRNCFTSYSLQIVEFQRQVDGLFFGSGWHLSSTAMFEYPNSTAMAQLINIELFSNNSNSNSNSNSAMASQQSSGPLSISVNNNEHATATANTTTDNPENDAGNDSSDDDEVEVIKTEPVQNSIGNPSAHASAPTGFNRDSAQHLAPLTVTPQPQRRRSSVQCQQGSPAPLAMLSPASTSNGCVTVSNGSGMSPVVTPTSETVGSGRKMSVVTSAAPGGAMPYTQAEVWLMCVCIHGNAVQCTAFS
jgi:hypothetical protein